MTGSCPENSIPSTPEGEKGKGPLGKESLSITKLKPILPYTLKTPSYIFLASAFFVNFPLTNFPQATQECSGVLLPLPLLRLYRVRPGCQVVQCQAPHFHLQ